MSAIFSIVTGTQLVKIHEQDSLFAAAAEAGIPLMELTQGMVFQDDGAYLRVENTRRIPKVRKTVVKATKADTPEARKARVVKYAGWYTPERRYAEESYFDN